jgi:NAD(P)-dependent dehydrogenase (short-subunit alcohol dehydrogenase family)
MAENISEKGWRAVMETNLNGPFHMMAECFRQAFGPASAGAIVNVIAISQPKGFPIMSHTGAARAAVGNLTKSLAVEWARAGVRVNAVAPGRVDSGGFDNYPVRTPANAPANVSPCLLVCCVAPSPPPSLPVRRRAR